MSGMNFSSRANIVTGIGFCTVWDVMAICRTCLSAGGIILSLSGLTPCGTTDDDLTNRHEEKCALISQEAFFNHCSGRYDSPFFSVGKDIEKI